MRGRTRVGGRREADSVSPPILSLPHEGRGDRTRRSTRGTETVGDLRHRQRGGRRPGARGGPQPPGAPAPVPAPPPRGAVPAVPVPAPPAVVPAPVPAPP